ncbi:MAG: OsmC family peroxiredoxin, partial [Rhodanobacteraceae bacterium]|nr:OsmC family peroxiredoxin [Rhodanobacteraceae bacterium]
RNAQGRWRIPRAQVTLTLADKAAALEHFERALAQFEQFCIVTQSVRDGIAVDVRVVDADGVVHVPGARA